MTTLDTLSTANRDLEASVHLAAPRPEAMREVDAVAESLGVPALT
jgi:hypothetical protein